MLSRPGWLIYSGRFTYISGHPSAAGRAQDSESSPVRDRRSTTEPRNQPGLRRWRPQHRALLEDLVVVGLLVHSVYHLHRDHVATTFELCHISTSSSRMRVMSHNWSATKQRLHPQSVAEISHHSVLSGDRIRHFN